MSISLAVPTSQGSDGIVAFLQEIIGAARTSNSVARTSHTGGFNRPGRVGHFRDEQQQEDARLRRLQKMLHFQQQRMKGVTEEVVEPAEESAATQRVDDRFKPTAEMEELRGETFEALAKVRAVVQDIRESGPGVSVADLQELRRAFQEYFCIRHEHKLLSDQEREAWEARRVAVRSGWADLPDYKEVCPPPPGAKKFTNHPRFVGDLLPTKKPSYRMFLGLSKAVVPSALDSTCALFVKGKITQAEFKDRLGALLVKGSITPCQFRQFSQA